jgi:hypothetical protein
LNEFMAIARRCQLPKVAEPEKPKPTWVEGACSNVVIRLIYELSKRDVILSDADLMILVRARDGLVEQFNSILTVDKSLLTTEVQKAMWKKLQKTVEAHPSLGRAVSNFSMLLGPSMRAAPSTSGLSKDLGRIESIPSSNTNDAVAGASDRVSTRASPSR